MHCCKYLTITGERCTKLLPVQDIRFFQDRVDITAQCDTNNHLANIICIMFWDQKNGEKDKAITLSRTTDPIIMCPVRQGAGIVNRILTIPSQTEMATINTYVSGSCMYRLKSDTAITRVQQLVKDIGRDQLGHKTTAYIIQSAVLQRWP